jgi:hypothetical protein
LALAAVVDSTARRARRGEGAVGAVAESAQRRPGAKVLGQGPAMLVQVRGELAADEADVPRFRAVPGQTLFAGRIAEREPVLVPVRGQPLDARRRGQPQVNSGAELVLAVARACGSAPLLRRPKDARLLAVRPKCGVDAHPEPSGPGARQQRAERLGRLGFDAVFATRARIGGVVQAQRARRCARADRKTARRVDPGEATGRSGCGRCRQGVAARDQHVRESEDDRSQASAIVPVDRPGDSSTSRPRLRLAHGVARVGHTRRRDGLDELDADVAADAREQSRPAAEHHRRERERDFVDEPGAQVLLDGVGAAGDADVAIDRHRACDKQIYFFLDVCDRRARIFPGSSNTYRNSDSVNSKSSMASVDVTGSIS